MAQDKVNPLSNLSYTNKDFETIYPELLDLVKQLTYKWDPSISNESDPGVILLKLNAIIADKCNYNIDKNTLECFPLSVTQESNARQLYEQLGYYMDWYTSATTNISLKWTSDSSAYSYTIPAFTPVSDYDNSIVYTLVGPTNDSDKYTFNVGSQKLKCDGSQTVFKAIQGVATEYNINGSTLITVANLDENNRLYFPTTDVAQNGIFITNYGLNNYTSWKLKENLLLEDLGSLIYKFGVSKDGSTCYIEFPDDAEKIFKEGINITYINTQGLAGNVAATAIEKFYNDLVPEEDDAIVLNTDNVKIQNSAAAKNGTNPETIDEAYSHYKKTIGTFKTLVTLRDYFNYICESKLVSNCVICDRTNDPQSTFKIVSNVDGISTQVTQVETDESGDPALTAFSLKLYLLQYSEVVDDYDSFNKTFSILTENASSPVKSYIEESKSIQHDYVSVAPTAQNSAHFCYFKNKYPINVRLSTQYQLTKSEADDLVTNVKQALFKELNSKEIEFGSAISSDLVYDTIQNSDSRIKNISLENIVYTPYAVYFDGDKFNEISLEYSDNAKFTTEVTSGTPAYNTGCVVTINDYDKLVNFLRSNSAYDLYINGYIKVVPTSLSSISIISGETTKNISITNLEENTGIKISYSGSTPSDAIIKIFQTNEYTLTRQFREEIYVKSVLAGATQLLVKDETFDYRLNQSINYSSTYPDGIIKNIEKLEGEFEKTFSKSSTEYTLRTNENIQLYAPNLLEDSNYSNYVKYEYYIRSLVNANSNYELKQGEYLLLYWKDDTTENSIYKYYCYGQGNIFSPTFDMSAKTSTEGIVGSILYDGCRNIGTDANPILVADSGYNGDMPTDISNSISNLTDVLHVLSGVKTITTKKVNEIELDSTDYYCYWVLNDSSKGKYTLFDTTDSTRVLNSGEYFFYSTSSLSDLVVLGAGTEITRSSISGGSATGTAWSVTKIDSTSIIEDGTSALADVWFKIPSGTKLKVVENQYINIGAGASIQITKNTTSSWTLTLTKSPTDLSEYTVLYKSASDAAYTKLSDMSISSGSWKARTMLSIVMSPSEEQVLLSGHKIYYHIFGDTTTYDPITGGDKGSSNYYPVVLLSSLETNISSGELSDVYSTDEYGNQTFLSILNFKKYVDDSSITYNSSGAAILDFKGSSSGASETKSFKFSLPTGKYILPLTNSRDKLTSFKVKLDSNFLAPIYNSSLTELKQTGTYYLTMNLDSSAEHTLSVIMSGHTDEVIITMTNPYRYDKPDTLTANEFKDMMDLLADFDSGHRYNYTYEVSSDNEISNPLLGESFIMENHPFNSYTICQMDTSSNSSVYVLGKK